MAKETTTFGLNSEKLVHLLRIGEDAASGKTEADSDRHRAELLHDLLAQPLPVRGTAKEELTSRQSQLRKKMDVLSSEPIGKLLLDPNADIATVRMVKDYGSRLSKRARSKAEHHAANTVYFAALASALAYHDLKITRYTYESLAKSLLRLAGEEWVPSSLCSLFAETSAICEQKT